MKNLPLYSVLILVWLILSNALSFADDTHFNSTLIGERASGMGGAFTAVSSNAAGLYYNPAGITTAAPNVISSSVQLIQVVNKAYDNFYGDQQFNKGSFGITGVYTGYIKELRFGKVGFSIAIPDSLKEEVDHRWEHEQGWPYPDTSEHGDMAYFDNHNFNTSSLLELDYEYKVYNFGPSYAFPLTTNFSFGVTLYYHMKRTRQINSIIKNAENYKTENDGENEEVVTYANEYMENYSRSVTESGVRPIVGIMYRNSRRDLSFGLTFSQIFVLSAEDKYRESLSEYRESTDDDYEWLKSSYSYHYENAVEEKRAYPYNIKLGGAWSLNKDTLFAMDLSFFNKSRRRVFSKGMERRYDNTPVLNLAIGAEHQIMKRYFVRAGLFTDYANTPGNDKDLRDIETEHVDLYGGSVSISRKSSELSYFTLGFSFRFGEGKACIKEDPELVLDVKQTVYNLFLSASF